MTIRIVISLLKIPYVHRIYLQMYGSCQPYLIALIKNYVGQHTRDGKTYAALSSASFFILENLRFTSQPNLAILKTFV